MQLAFITSDERGGADRLLAGFARDLADRGVSLAGVVQSNTERPGAGPCDMDLTLLPDGPVIRISQSLGDGARGCRLDTAALEDAVAHVGARLSAAPDLLILNKFGKREANGHGFRALIGQAVSAGVPVLLAVPPSNRAAFDLFTGGLAEPVPAQAAALRAWFARAASPTADGSGPVSRPEA
ncbi:MAG: DUF2478 domain-containing protein [Rhodobacteraceae bacterium]|nr:DUF2478 domain-containing protein [Paracoccaceae bacterium]